MSDQFRNGTNAFLFDGRKSININNFPKEAWSFLSGESEDDKDLRDLYRKIPWLYRGIEIRAGGLASLPFTIYRGDTVIDDSSSYVNALGFLPDPFRLLWLIEASMSIVGNAYLFNALNPYGQTKELRYLVPTSIKPKIDPDQGLTGFERRLNGKAPISFAVEDIIYFWRPDYQIEIGPSQNSPGIAACAAAGVIFNVDQFASLFFERGAVKATILGVPKDTPAEARAQIKSWFDGLISGIKNLYRTEVIQSDAININVIGEGIKELENVNLTNEKREDIATALGIPHSLLFSNAANYATARQDDYHFYKKVIEPDGTFIQSVINQQILNPLGFQWEFNYEQLEVFQDEEVNRSAALSNLARFLPVITSMQILGYDLPSDMTWEELQTAIDEDQQRKDERRQQFFGGGNYVPAEPVQQPDQQRRIDPMLIDIEKWQTKAVKAVKRGESALVSFESDHIPPTLSAAILGALEIAETPEEVKRTFSGVLNWHNYP